MRMNKSNELRKEDYISEDPMACCGVVEMSGIAHFRNDPTNAVVDMLCCEEYDYDSDGNDKPYLQLDPPKAAHIVFTQASKTRCKSGYGYAIASYIIQQGLGTVANSQPARNPNTSNQITVFVWTPNIAGIKSWAKRNGIRR